jgi:hypothetical protein
LCCVRTLTCAPASDPPLLPLDPEELVVPDDAPELEVPLDPEEPVDPVEPADPEELPEPDEPVEAEASPTVSLPAPEPEEPQAARTAFPSVQATAIDAIEDVRMRSSPEIAPGALRIQEGSRPADRLSEDASAARVLLGRESSRICVMSRFRAPPPSSVCGAYEVHQLALAGRRMALSRDRRVRLERDG